jgi:tripartite-type tricarboxylate transporter receptor subunit TctC
MRIIPSQNLGTLRRQCRRALICLMGLALILIANTASTFAQGNDAKWPDRPVRFIVPFPAGSASDIVARIIARKLGAQLGQQFVIDNRPGASGDIGTEAVARAAPDGYTIGLATSSTHVVAASLNPKLSYDPVADFAPVSMIGTSPYVLAIYPGVPAQSVTELIALAKAKPRAFNYASVGPASLAHVAGALFSDLAGVELTEVPYRSSNQAILDVTEGRIEMQFGTLGPTLGQIRDGKLRALAITGAKRVESLPDVPTLQEAGLAGYEVVLWMAVVMPAASPPAIVARLNHAMRDALVATDVAVALKAQGVESDASTPDAVRERIHAEITKWRNLAPSTDLKAEP